MRAALLALLLTACTVGPAYTPPDLTVPKNESLERWWTVFGDPQLNSLIDRAVEGNLDLAIADARVREARAARGIIDSAAQPQVNGGGRIGRTQRSEATPPFDAPRTRHLFDVGWDASWEIDLFGGVRRDREAALAQAQAAEEARRDVLVTLLAEVARNYLELRAAQKELAVVDATVRARQETLELVRARARAGLDRELDVARAEELLAGAKSQQPLVSRNIGEAIHRLGVLLGDHPDSLVETLTKPAPLPDAPVKIPATLRSELLSRRPDLRRAERELAAATARVGVAQAELFPRFVILGNFGRLSDDLGDLGSGGSQFGGVIAGALWPVLSGGRIRANVRVHNARQEQAAKSYERAVLVALGDVASSLLWEARERERQQSLRESVAASRRGFEIALARYRGGLSDYLPVLDAQRSLHDAEQVLVRSERDRSLAVIGLYKSLGGGWSVEQEEQR